jgi:hypothetical protein
MNSDLTSAQRAKRAARSAWRKGAVDAAPFVLNAAFEAL